MCFPFCCDLSPVWSTQTPKLQKLRWMFLPIVAMLLLDSVAIFWSGVTASAHDTSYWFDVDSQRIMFSAAANYMKGVLYVLVALMFTFVITKRFNMLSLLIMNFFVLITFIFAIVNLSMLAGGDAFYGGQLGRMQLFYKRNLGRKVLAKINGIDQSVDPFPDLEKPDEKWEKIKAFWYFYCTFVIVEVAICVYLHAATFFAYAVWRKERRELEPLLLEQHEAQYGAAEREAPRQKTFDAFKGAGTRLGED